jgi:hypothetical protein
MEDLTVFVTAGDFICVAVLFVVGVAQLHSRSRFRGCFNIGLAALTVWKGLPVMILVRA